MADAVSIRALAAQVTQDYPQLNILINMAGVMLNEKMLNQKEPLVDAEATVATNLLGPIRLTAALLPALLKQPHSTIMNVSSGLAFVPLAMTPTYSATKAAIHSYTQSLRYQLQDTPVEVLELVPPYVQTGLMGDRQAHDPAAMPLGDYVAEVMSILQADPTPLEICVERVKSRRFAEANGGYDAFFKQMNDAMMAARAGEFNYSATRQKGFCPTSVSKKRTNPMIEHVVLFRWKPEATGEQVAEVMEGLRGLKDRIPGIVTLACGADFSGRAQGYTHGLVVRFSDRAALDAYGPHPDHQAVIETRIKPILEGILGFNFEVV